MNMPDTKNRLHIEQQEINRLELRSEEVMDILGSLPHWTIRSGSFYLLGLVLLAITVTWFIKYPNVLVAPVVVTTETPPLAVISQGSGYIQLLVKDKEQVNKGQLLGYLSSSADVNEVLSLKTELDSLNTNILENPFFLGEHPLVQRIRLGELQELYNSFRKTLTSYQLSCQQQGYRQQIRSLQQQVAGYALLIEQTKEKNDVMHQELQLADKHFSRDSILFANNVLSNADFEDKKQIHLQNLRDYKNAGMSVTSYKIQCTQLEGRIAELFQQEQTQNKNYLLSIESGIRQLDQAIHVWMETHVLLSPMDGRVALFSYWADQQYVKSGEEILSVVPETSNFFGMAKVPVSGSGELQYGQMVNIRLDNFSSGEYGMLEGSVENISLLPREQNYLIRIRFTDGLRTTYGKRLEAKQEMVGQAQIVTKDMRLLERFFYQFRKATEGGA